MAWHKDKTVIRIDKGHSGPAKESLRGVPRVGRLAPRETALFVPVEQGAHGGHRRCG